MSWKPGVTKIFLPNIVFKMVRDDNLPPNRVAFRIPPRLNKLDIRDYLWNIYKVEVVDVRTMVYATRPGKKLPGRPRIQHRGRFKKAIVTLKSDFHYPPPIESFEFASREEQVERRALVFRRLAGWKSRPKQLMSMYVERAKKLEEQQKKEKEEKEKTQNTQVESKSDKKET
ncbi:hypothetical protein G9A89_019820 [Geosiphon pyriformis]|nr:hypothetical protein G9A89_019820 [Geosiphon pyriformis]